MFWQTSFFKDVSDNDVKAAKDDSAIDALYNVDIESDAFYSGTIDYNDKDVDDAEYVTINNRKVRKIPTCEIRGSGSNIVIQPTSAKVESRNSGVDSDHVMTFRSKLTPILAKSTPNTPKGLRKTTQNNEEFADDK